MYYMCVMLMAAKRSCQIPRNVRATRWMLGIELESSERVGSALNSQSYPSNPRAEVVKVRQEMSARQGALWEMLSL